MWFVLIVRVALHVLRGGPAHEVRSEDEGEEDEIDEEEEKAPLVFAHHETLGDVEQAPYEEEVGVEAINLRGRTSTASRYRKGNSSASGVSLPGHSDRKELLGRIGCDKGV